MEKFKIKSFKPTKQGFGEGLLEIGRRNPNVISLGADITSSVGSDLFANEFPERFFSFGIAEQNIMAVAAGLAQEGKIPFFATYAVFAALRTTDQIRISVCYNNVPVKIGGAHAGISVGPDGATHQALEDIAIMRVLPNMTVLSPCDATQIKLATIASVEQVNGPCYIRFGRAPVPDFTQEDLGFEVGKGQLLIQGEDLTIISTGILTWEAINAIGKLEKLGVSTRLINLHTIKPIDEEIIINAAKETGAILTAEEHQIIGGLGSAVAEVVVKNHPVLMDFIGINDSFGESGQPNELMKKYGLDSNAIYDRAINLLERKNGSK